MAQKSIGYLDDALAQIAEVVDFLRENATEASVERFISAIEKQENKLRKFPEIGRQSAYYPDVRHVLIEKHYWLYYRITESEILFLALFDTRQSPSKKPF